MFEDSLLESGNRLRTKRGMTTAISIALQGALLGLAVLAPLLYTEALPRQQMMGILTAPAPPPPPPRTTASPAPVGPASESTDGHGLRLPSVIPVHAVEIVDPPAAAFGPGNQWGVPGGTGDGPPNGVFRSDWWAHEPPPPAAAHRNPTHVGGQITQGHLILQVKPSYPRRPEGTGSKATSCSRQ